MSASDYLDMPVDELDLFYGRSITQARDVIGFDLPPRPIWRCGDGRRVPVEEMDDQHLMNAINYVWKKYSPAVSGFGYLGHLQSRVSQMETDAKLVQKCPCFVALVEEAAKRGFLAGKISSYFVMLKKRVVLRSELDIVQGRVVKRGGKSVKAKAEPKKQVVKKTTTKKNSTRR